MNTSWFLGLTILKTRTKLWIKVSCYSTFIVQLQEAQLSLLLVSFSTPGDHNTIFQNRTLSLRT